MSGEGSLELGCVLLSGLASVTLMTVFILRSKGRREKKIEKTNYSVEDDFDEINYHLQTDLNNKIIERISQVKTDIKARKLQLNRNVEDLLSQQEADISVKMSEFEIAKEIIVNNYKEKIEVLKKETETDISELKDAVRSLRIILAGASDTVDTLTNTRAELECPVCLEEMKPPRRIWQCSDGHIICDFCRKKPTVTCCPTCRKYIVGRSNIAEKLSRSLFGGCQESDSSGLPGPKTKCGGRITLTGYREVTSSTEEIYQ